MFCLLPILRHFLSFGSVQNIHFLAIYAKDLYNIAEKENLCKISRRNKKAYTRLSHRIGVSHGSAA